MWYLYILQCGDGSLYTGITTDVEKRLEAHRSGKGAKYTRGRSPLELKYREGCGTHSDALKRELEIKHLSREEKLALIGIMITPCGVFRAFKSLNSPQGVLYCMYQKFPAAVTKPTPHRTMRRMPQAARWAG